MNKTIFLALLLGLWLSPSRECRAETKDLILIVNTERGEKVNPDPGLIGAALLRAGAKRTMVVHFTVVDSRFLAMQHPAALVLSGQATPWENYSPRELGPFLEGVRRYQGPILGICGGHQALALAFGGKVGFLGRASGARELVREKGWLSVQLLPGDDQLFRGIGSNPVFWFNHNEEVLELPRGFQRIASSAQTQNCAMRYSGRPVYGIQFHPEVNLDSTGCSQVLIKNFLGLADIH
jgi:GMP synthase (glutamine-hydrolysing)